LESFLLLLISVAKLAAGISNTSGSGGQTGVVYTGVQCTLTGEYLGKFRKNLKWAKRYF
jgi:hypothetical protein